MFGCACPWSTVIWFFEWTRLCMRQRWTGIDSMLRNIECGRYTRWQKQRDTHRTKKYFGMGSKRIHRANGREREREKISTTTTFLPHKKVQLKIRTRAAYMKRAAFQKLYDNKNLKQQTWTHKDDNTIETINNNNKWTPSSSSVVVVIPVCFIYFFVHRFFSSFNMFLQKRMKVAYCRPKMAKPKPIFSASQKSFIIKLHQAHIDWLTASCLQRGWTVDAAAGCSGLDEVWLGNFPCVYVYSLPVFYDSSLFWYILIIYRLFILIMSTAENESKVFRTE